MTSPLNRRIARRWSAKVPADWPRRDPFYWAAVWSCAGGLVAAAPVESADLGPLRRAIEQYALTHEGDATRGQELFAQESVTKCAACHQVNGKGGQIGPDLTHIGGKFGRPHLIESLLEPSRQIVDGFRTPLIRTTDGSIHAGVVKEQSSEQVALLDAAGNRVILATAEIEQRKDSPISLMPEGLASVLTREDFTDLIAYLETLRLGGKPTPG